MQAKLRFAQKIKAMDKFYVSLGRKDSSELSPSHQSDRPLPTVGAEKASFAPTLGWPWSLERSSASGIGSAPPKDCRVPLKPSL